MVSVALHGLTNSIEAREPSVMRIVNVTYFNVVTIGDNCPLFLVEPQDVPDIELLTSDS